MTGFKAVTATALPTVVGSGNGRRRRGITCAGPGVPWQPGVEQSNCSYTYTTSSVHQPQIGADVNNRPFQLSATVMYQVSWTCAGQCGGITTGVCRCGGRSDDPDPVGCRGNPNHGDRLMPSPTRRSR